MKIGVVANVLQDKPLAEALQIFRDLGIEQIEPGCGGYAGKAHVDPVKLLSSPAELENLKRMLQDTGIAVSALSCHGNPVHPDKDIFLMGFPDRTIASICEKSGFRLVTYMIPQEEEDPVMIMVYGDPSSERMSQLKEKGDPIAVNIVRPLKIEWT